jgi:molecular chaperone HtpG
MSSSATTSQADAPQGAIPFRAETRQLLDILIHSLYTEKEVFLRELISNASDALTRMNFEMLTNHDVLEPDAELGIWITANTEEKTLTIRDSGVGMTRDELVENLGTIAHSGARAFLQAAKDAAAQNSATPVSDIIGQFGVGFYSAFMVAEWIRVTAHSFRKDAEAQTWFSAGEDTYTIEPGGQTERGTTVIVKLKEDAAEFAEENRLREIIKKHSDFIPYPIYLGEEKQLVNQRTALWRQSPREVEAEKYDEFYRQFTLDFEPPLTHGHMVVDAPVQLYALLFVPSSAEKNIFSLRKEEGLKLYARKVLIQEYSRDLLPEYFRFMQGVVDSEDLQLNVSRESIQSSRVIAQIRRALTGKVLDMLKKMAEEEKTAKARRNEEEATARAQKPKEDAKEEEQTAEAEPTEEKEAGTEQDSDKEPKKEQSYTKFWGSFGRFIKEGIATAGGPTGDREGLETLPPLLRYHTLNHPGELVSLDDYIRDLKPDQKKIYYILGDDDRSVIHSPHLDVFRHAGVDVLLMTDPLDSFTLITLNKYKDFPLVNASAEQPEVKAEEQPAAETESGVKSEPLAADVLESLVQRFKDALGERVSDVRSTDRLIDSPARLVDKEGSLNQEVQRVYRLLRQEYEVPQKVLEINPRHSILKKLSEQPAEGEISKIIIEQIYEDALLIEGLHPDPAGMIERIQELMKAALK